ncbi:mRNA 3'-end-processing protein RNA14 [Plectosphaerella plurivora]|uniref:mRNA 3'-end-processing protein RNA14 n=1 Tax=Plectosphaerella plurivora TaxID=936078 RepID=A0A9P9A4T2_9PEZI|nr:mRNA 3'-end-processing protein RNA14 [Plectosphaerella plurivora]
MAPELQETGEQHEGAAWVTDNEGNGAVKETQHSDQEHQDPDFSHDQASHGDQEEEQLQEMEEDGEQDDDDDDDDEGIEEGDEDGEADEEGDEDEGGEEADAEVEAETAPQEEDPEDEEPEYDPESISMTPAQVEDTTPVAAPAAPSASAKPAKPKKSGGFLVGDSDDEDEARAAPNPAAPEQPATTAPQQEQPTASVPSPVQVQVRASSVTAGNAAHAAPTAAATAPTAAPASDLAASLESRVQEDPRGEMDSWLGLMAEYRRLNQLDALRQVYERFIQHFPQSAEIWVEWIKLELDCMNTTAAEALFQRSLLTVADVRLWTTYINYIRRRNDLVNDPNGAARQVISQSYEFVIDNVGMDRESGQLWKDWIQFIKSGPGQVGGGGWQDQQKMDQLRKAFHRAIAVPMTAVTDLWKDYDQFELGLNKATGRQFIQKRSPGYMTAKSASLQMDRKLGRLQRTTLPRLAPMPGFAGDQEFKEQVEIWKDWIQWEKEDPLVLKDEEPEAYYSRVLYAYKQAVMALRFWPEIWVDAAEWSFANNINRNGIDMGSKFLTDGIEANPESVLLALKHGDRIEMTHPAGDTDESKEARAAAIREPYDRVLDTLYKMIVKLKERGEKEIAKAKQAAEQMDAANRGSEDRNDDDDDNVPRISHGEEMVKAVKQGNDSQIELMKRTISFVWTALCRAIRRVVGKGSPNSGLRKIFIEARTRGQLTSEIYTAVALIEHHVYKDIAGTKIFDRGAKLFPDDETFMLEYIKFLHSKDDSTNARVAFETCVNKLTQSAESKHKARSLYKYFHKYESQYGELSSIAALEKRMAELWPEDPKLSHFSNRFSTETFDPIAYRLIISPAVQLRPKLMPSIEQPMSIRDSPAPAPPALTIAPPPIRQSASPAPQYLNSGITNSPKRPFPGDDQDDFNRPRKVARGESPLKGAAGRRMDQSRRNNAAPLSRDITFLLGILPPAHSYRGDNFNASNLVGLIRNTEVPDFNVWRSSQDRGQNARTASGSHARQPSGGDYSGYTRGESPKPRPQSPFDAAGRRVASGGPAYRNSPLSATAFEPPQQAAYGQPAQGQWPPPAASYDGAPPANWAPPPSGYGQQQQQYGQQYQY